MPPVAVNRVQANGHQDKKEAQKEQIRIAPLRQAIISVPCVGESPLKVLRFSKKKRDQIEETQRAGEQARNKRKRIAKDFEQEYEDAKYVCTQKSGREKETWLGLNASGIRNGCIETCRVAGFVMTKAKMSVFCIADGYDDLDKTALVRIHGEVEMTIDPVRNDSGVIDLRPRACFPEWRIVARLRFDEDQFSPSDIINLMIRVGQQNGLGEGRPNGKDGNGTGNGLFTVDMDNVTLQRLSSSPIVFKE